MPRRGKEKGGEQKGGEDEGFEEQAGLVIWPFTHIPWPHERQWRLVGGELGPQLAVLVQRSVEDQQSRHPRGVIQGPLESVLPQNIALDKSRREKSSCGRRSKRIGHCTT
jgi:hypothetical protein